MPSTEHLHRALPRPRGRPQRLPYDDSPALSPAVDGNKRLAWLIATRRIHSMNGGSKSRAGFAQLLREQGYRADSSRISRWESGAESLPESLILAYEHAIGIRDHSLVTLRRLCQQGGHLDDRSAPRESTETFDAGWLDHCMERIQSQTMQGTVWMQFADELQKVGQIYLPQRMWRATTDLLVEELGRSVGMAFLHRYTAVSSLLRHGVAGGHLSRSIGQYSLHPETQMIPRVLPALAEVPDHAAAALLHRLVASSPEPASGAAALAASTLGVRGCPDLAEGEVGEAPDALERYVGQALFRDGGSPRYSLIGIACQLEESHFQRVLGSLNDARVRLWLTRSRETCELIGRDQARAISDAVGHEASQTLGAWLGDTDAMLTRLVREALFHVHHHRRVLASHLILASPYAAAVGEQFLALTASEDLVVARLAWAGVRRLGDHLDVDTLESRALTETRPQLQFHVFAALSLAGGPRSPEVIRHIMTRVMDSETAQEVALAGIRALGMGRCHADLHAIRRPDLQPAAGWWLAAGGAIRER